MLLRTSADSVMRALDQLGDRVRISQQPRLPGPLGARHHWHSDPPMAWRTLVQMADDREDALTALLERWEARGRSAQQPPSAATMDRVTLADIRAMQAAWVEDAGAAVQQPSARNASVDVVDSVQHDDDDDGTLAAAPEPGDADDDDSGLGGEVALHRRLCIMPSSQPTPPTDPRQHVHRRRRHRRRSGGDDDAPTALQSFATPPPSAPADRASVSSSPMLSDPGGQRPATAESSQHSRPRRIAGF